MKFITIKIETIDRLIDKIVNKNEPGYNQEVAQKNVAKTLWSTIISPMDSQQTGSLAFLHSYMKCKDLFLDIFTKIDAGEIIENVGIEDTDFDILYDTFMKFNQWKLDFARVILIASECLIAANKSNILGKPQ